MLLLLPGHLWYFRACAHGNHGFTPASSWDPTALAASRLPLSHSSHRPQQLGSPACRQSPISPDLG